MKMDLIKSNKDLNINSKVIVLSILILMIFNSILLGVFAENLYANENSYTSSSRSNEVIGRLVETGNYSGTVNPTTNPSDFYTIYFNGSSTNTDLVTIRAGTTSVGSAGSVQFDNIDHFNIDFDFFSVFGTNIQFAQIKRPAITSGYHYISVAGWFGTANYWVNISIRKITNNNNDANNDFGNCTVAVNDDSFHENLNYSLDYWDLYQITVPPDKNLTITGEPSGEMNIVMELYDAKNSSSEHIVNESDTGWGGQPEVLYFDTNVSAFTVYVRIYAWWDENDAPYWLNFTIIDHNKRPGLNPSDPKFNLWTSSVGIEINEDQSSVGEINLSEHFIDDNKPDIPGELTFNHSSSDDNISVQIASDSKVTFTPASNWHGSAVVTFFANDSVYNVSDEINITVLPVNDPPVVQNIPDKVWTQGTDVNLGIVISDVDDTEFSISDNTTLFNVDQENSSINFTPTNDQVGEHFINISVSDGEAYSSIHFKATINNINDPPEYVRIGGKDPVPDGEVEFTVKEDKWNNFTVKVSDIDHDVGVMDDFIFSINITDPAFKIDTDTGNISVFPLQKHVNIGAYLIKLTVNDGKGGYANQTLNFTVQNVNDPPTAPEITLVNKTNLTVKCSVEPVFDEDDDALNYTWDFGDGTAPVELGLVGNYTYDKPGNYTISVRVTDGVGGLSWDELTVNVTRFIDINDTNGNVTNGDNGNQTNGNKTFIDIDEDGLDDDWEIENFGNITAQSGTDDWDKDGFTNLEEFTANTDPTKSTDRPLDDKKDTKDDESDFLSSESGYLFYLLSVLGIVNFILIIIIIFMLLRKRGRDQYAEGAVIGRVSGPAGKDEFTIPCPECGKSVDENATECPYCGEEFEFEDYEDMDEETEEVWDRDREERGGAGGRGRGRAGRPKGRRDRYDEEEYPEEEEYYVEDEDEYYEEDEDEYYDDEEIPEDEIAEEEWDEDEEYDEEELAEEESYEEDDYDYVDEDENVEEEWDEE
jgi:hypothetical protein